MSHLKAVLTEAMFGVYPAREDVKYVKQAYGDVYRPANVKPTPDTWRRVFLNGAMTPLLVTRYGLHTQRYWYHDLLIFVFDPLRTTDVIDLWNLRLEPHPILPVPFQWFEALGDDIHKILKAEHRPVMGSPMRTTGNFAPHSRPWRPSFRSATAEATIGGSTC
jgi:hypothetical protein